jgi:probable phosphoglycerate mutase
MAFESASLRNTYFGLRHGWSDANAKGIIVSDPIRGIYDYGLLRQGESEVECSTVNLKEAHSLDESTIIISSDFRRTRESAKIAARVLGVAELVFVPALRERFFGRLESTSNTHYEEVWQRDAEDPTHTYKGVESAQAVLDRQLALLESLEVRFSWRKILLSSHGDPLHILQTAFANIFVSRHRSLPHLLDTGEIREFISSPGHAG